MGLFFCCTLYLLNNLLKGFAVLDAVCFNATLFYKTVNKVHLLKVPVMPAVVTDVIITCPERSYLFVC